MLYLLYGIHVIVCIFLILVVLLQQGKGADLSVFGGGSTQTAFGARSATTLLHKLTVTSFVLFIFTTLLIGIMQGGSDRASLMSEVLGDEVSGQTPPAEGTDQNGTAAQPATGDEAAQPAGQTAAPDQSGQADQANQTDQAPPADQGAAPTSSDGSNGSGGSGGGE